MTPHDELMALAGKATPGEWEAGGDSDPTAILARDGWAQVAMTNDALPEAGDNAAFIAAACNFVRSDAFRAMVRDAADAPRLRSELAAWNELVTMAHVNRDGLWPNSWPQNVAWIAWCLHSASIPPTLTEAIDAAASGAITPPTSEGEK